MVVPSGFVNILGHMKHNKNAAYLETNGPTAHDHLPYKPGVDAQRIHGIQRFRVIGGRVGGGDRIGGQTSPVYYLKEHEPKAVVRRWFGVNPRVRRQNNPKSIQRRLLRTKREWKDAYNVVLEEEFGENCLGTGSGGANDAAHVGPDAPEKFARDLGLLD